MYFFELDKLQQDRCRKALESVASCVFVEDSLSKDNVDEYKDAEYIVCFIYSDLSAEVLDELPKLRGIITMSVGTDHIDLSEAAKREITVSNVPAYGANTVAEHTAALLLAISRRIIDSVQRTKEGDYDYSGLTGFDLADKSIAVLGTGKIGAHLIGILNGLRMKIYAYDPHPNLELVEKYGVEYMSFIEAISAADIITCHMPLNDHTRHILDREQFAKMKDGVVILNTARGGLINVPALLEALESGKVAYAGLDVLEEENLLREESELFSKHFNLKDYQLALANHALMKHPKVIVTPHNAFNSVEALDNILSTTIDNILAVLSGKPINSVSAK